MAVVITGAFSSIAIVAYESYAQPQSRAESPPLSLLATATPPAEGGADFLAGVPLLIVAPDGSLTLYDRAGGSQGVHTVEQGTVVRIIGAEKVASTTWFHVELAESGAQGWVATTELTVEVAVSPRFDSFLFCAGDASGPSGPCGSELPLEAEAIWLRWRFQGLQPGDKVQRLLIVEGERYAAPPESWQGPASGEQLVELRGSHQPRPERGAWVVEIFVNDQLAGESSVWVR